VHGILCKDITVVQILRNILLWLLFC